MSISITNDNPIFDNKNVTILVKDFGKNEEITFKKNNDFVIILTKSNKIVGFNVFNYEKYFSIKKGFHKLSNEVIQYLLKMFPDYVKQENFDSFYKIGIVTNIENHPTSEKLKVLTVKQFDKEKQIITNIQDIKINKKYLFATNGSITYSGLRIYDSKIKDIKSEGMIMSYKSLGINKEGLVNCDNLSINDEFDF